MRRHRLAGLAAIFAVLLGASLTSCAAAASNDSGSQSSEQIPVSDTLTVYAAASLKLGFGEIAAAFEAEHGGTVKVNVLTDGSSTLAIQILEGAPADVFASADQRNMAVVTEAGLANDPQLFATNSLVIVVPAGNPAGVQSLADLADVTSVLCAEAVPCGTASMQLLELAGVQVTPASSEQNVTAVLQKVVANEADAGLVYATDVIGDDAVEYLVPKEAASVVNQYPIAVLAGAANVELAQSFVDFVTGDTGQSILAGRGFGSA